MNPRIGIWGRAHFMMLLAWGAGSLSVSCASLVPEKQTNLSVIKPIAVAVTVDKDIVDPRGKLSFNTTIGPANGTTIPAPVSPLPLDYTVTDAAGVIVAKGRTETGRETVIDLPASAQGLLWVRVLPGKGVDAALLRQIGPMPIEKPFLRGDAPSIFAERAAKARQAAAVLSGGVTEPWASLAVKEKAALVDVAPTLEFLADRLEAKLPANLNIPELRLKAVGFVDDLLAAMARGPAALAVMSGYRQMAYRSDIDGSVQPYSLYLPAGYAPEKKYRLVVMVHGSGGEDHVWGNYLAYLKPADFLIVSVFGRGDVGYRSLAEQDVLDVMDRVLARYSVDPNEVYLIGNSAGGNGVWKIGTFYPERFAAIAPVSGWCGTDWLVNLRNVSTYVIHGSDDGTVPVRMDRAVVARLEQLGYPVQYDEIQHGSHYCWTEWIRSHDPQDMLDFFRSRERNPSPDKISAAVPYARYSRFYWLTIEELDTSGPLAPPRVTQPDPRTDPYRISVPEAGSVEAERTSKTNIAITTKRVNALSLNLKLAGADPTQPVRVSIDGVELETKAGAESVLLAKNAGRRWEIGEPPAAGKARHDGGGVADLFTRPLVIVCGTKNKERAPLFQTAANRLADWTKKKETETGVKIGKYRVKVDGELTEEDIHSSNLILIGKASENSISEKIAGVIAPYYSDGVITVQGKRYPDNGLCVVVPNPLAPERLVAYCDALPATSSPDAKWLEGWVYGFTFRFRLDAASEATSYPGFCPDVMVLTTDPFHDAWSGWFDRNWENLRGR